MAKRYCVLRKEDGTILGGPRLLKEGADAVKYTADRAAQGLRVDWCGKPPTIETMERWMCDGVAKTIHGKRTEPDGTDSWLIVLGLI
jgi:hypothetical protein